MSRALLCGLCVLGAATARAQDAGPVALQAELVRQAQAAEDAADPERAVALWQRAEDAAPGSRLSRRAGARLGWLRARSDGGYAPLGALMKLQSQGSQMSPEEVERVAQQADALPPSRVRVELRLALATQASIRQDRVQARRQFEACLREQGLRTEEEGACREGLARLLELRGEGAAAAEMLRQGPFPQGADAIDLRARRKTRSAISWVLLALSLVALVVSTRFRLPSREALRRTFAPTRVLVGGALVGFPAVLAALYDHEASDTFTLLCASLGAVLLVGLLARASLEDAASRARRAGIACAVVVAQLAVGYLALDRAGGLLSFGL